MVYLPLVIDIQITSVKINCKEKQRNSPNIDFNKYTNQQLVEIKKCNFNSVFIWLYHNSINGLHWQKFKVDILEKLFVNNKIFDWSSGHSISSEYSSNFLKWKDVFQYLHEPYILLAMLDQSRSVNVCVQTFPFEKKKANLYIFQYVAHIYIYI